MKTPRASEDKRTASQIYGRNQELTYNAIAELQTILVAHSRRQKAKPRDWGYPGDLHYAQQELQKLITFLGGGQ